MADLRLKRSSPCDDENDQDLPSKRQRTTSPESGSATLAPIIPTEEPVYNVVRCPTTNDLGREGLRRSIGLVLKHVGFDSATSDALESFTETVDTYITEFADHLRRTANAARRNNPTPQDFEHILRRYDVPLVSLRPHLKNPIPKRLLTPTFYDPITEDVQYLHKPRPFLGEELDGKKEKEERAWIPKGFPPFPSKHTYKFTIAELPTGNPEGKRAQAEADAKKGELALRRIDRAAKISRQKELREMAQQNTLTRERYHAWETIMTELLPQSGSSGGAAEMADHSTLVNFAAKYGRKEVPRASRRASAV
ncbi:hypothetical protein AAE478_007245 [Parahypoxylon ruwenzoriense]